MMARKKDRLARITKYQKSVKQEWDRFDCPAIGFFRQPGVIGLLALAALFLHSALHVLQASFRKLRDARD
jgi:hypothetical protein